MSLAITNVEAFVLVDTSIEPDGLDPTRKAVVVRVSTDAGIVGYGDSSSSPEIVKQVIDTPSLFDTSRSFRELLVGRDPLDYAAIWEEIYRLTGYPGTRGAVIHALSAVDIALWDIMGKAFGVPVYKLLGGLFHPRLPAYCSLVMPPTPDGVRELVGETVAAGWPSVKLGWFPSRSDEKLDRALVKAAREGAGASTRLLLDVGPRWDFAGGERSAVQLWDAKTAIQRIKSWEEFEPFWVEEPLPVDDVAGYRKLCQAVDTRIAAGEQHSTRFPIYELMDVGEIDVVQFDVTRVGGLTEGRRVAQAAADRNRPFAPRSYSTGIGLNATLHLLAASPNSMFLEYPHTDSLILNKLAGPMPAARYGIVTVTDAPGLGVEIDTDLLKHLSDASTT